MKIRDATKRVGEWQVYPAEGLLRRNESDRYLQPKVMDLLCRLMANAGEVVTREQLLSDIWQGRVSDDPLNRCIAELRAALGDDRAEPRYIQTLPRRGYRLIAPVSPVAPAPTRRASKHVLASLLSASLIAMLLLAFWPREEGAAETPRLLVLPLENLSADRTHDLLVDGLTEELINALANNTDLQVLSRTTSFSLRDRSMKIPDIMQQVRMDYAIEGSARIVDEQLRITVQLVDATMDTHLFSEIHEQPLSEAPAALEAIAQRVASAVGRMINPAGLLEHHALSPEVFQEFVQARLLWQQESVPALQQAIERLKRVVQLAPEFADAHAHLAAACRLLGAVPGQPPSLDAELDFHLDEALRLDPDNALARAVLSQRNTLDPAWSEMHLKAALAREPDLLLARRWLGQLYSRAGYLDAAIEVYRTAYGHDPFDWRLESGLARALWNAGRETEFLELVNNAGIALWKSSSPQVFQAALARGDADSAKRYLQTLWMHSTRVTAAELGRIVDGVLDLEQRAGAVRLVDDMLARNRPIPDSRAFEFYVLLGEYDRAFDLYLDGEQAPRDSGLLYLVWSKPFAPLRQHPRFIEWTGHLGLTEYWRTKGANDFCQPAGDSWRCD